MQLDFWIDPACPWCWVTSRWAVDIAPHRNLEIRWMPISLKVKNAVEPGSEWYEPLSYTHGLLRVLESVRTAEGDAPLGRLYSVMGESIHDRGERGVGAADMLSSAGLDRSHANAADDPAWDVPIQIKMDAGLALVGNDVGTPILAFDNLDGHRTGFFGPVITRRPPLASALRLWDGMMQMCSVDGFWELKRTRTERPDFSAPVG